MPRRGVERGTSNADFYFTENLQAFHDFTNRLNNLNHQNVDVLNERQKRTLLDDIVKYEESDHGKSEMERDKRFAVKIKFLKNYIQMKLDGRDTSYMFESESASTNAYYLNRLSVTSAMYARMFGMDGMGGFSGVHGV